jgi:hypothetical protein
MKITLEAVWVAVLALQKRLNSNVSGVNSGDQNIFGTVAVSGQSDVVSSSTSGTLTLAAGSGVVITTNPGTNTVTITASGAAGVSYIPLSVGTEPLAFVSDGAGRPILVSYTP